MNRTVVFLPVYVDPEREFRVDPDLLVAKRLLMRALCRAGRRDIFWSQGPLGRGLELWSVDRQGEVLNGRYHIERTLGRGGMGSVYLARQPELDAWVAVKEMDLSQIDAQVREACLTQFRAEARILNRLHHPNLPRVYDFFEEGGNQFLVMDYIDGGTLNQALETSAASEAQALQWARELCDVLDYLHHHNPPVIFKDLKTTNVMLAGDGSIRLIDFGIAKVFDPEASSSTVLKGSVSDGFAPIEQYGQGGTDPRSDIYALGATLYCVLSRRIPPAAPDRVGDSDPLVPLSEYRPDISERTLSAIEWMLQVSREARPRGIRDVVDALGLAAATSGTAHVTVPARIRHFVREQFHHIFPAPSWFQRPSLPLDGLAAYLQEARDEGVPAPMIGFYGEAGAGKSRVMGELRSMVRDGLEVLPVLSGNKLYRLQPFGALLPAMRALLRRKGDSILQAVGRDQEPQVLYEAASALPELLGIVPEGPLVRRSPADMTRSLITVMGIILDAGVGPRRGLLILDDAQWVDSATMRFLDQVRSGELGTKVAIMLAWHPDADCEPHREFVEAWQREGEAVLVAVPPLSADELPAYLDALLPPIADIERHFGDLDAISGGNPFLLEELLRLMVVRRVLREHNGVLKLDGFEPEHLPRQVDETVRRRLEHLPIDGQTLLSQASVVGLSFTLELLKELSGEDWTVLRESMQRAREAAFIRFSDESPGQYEFLSEATRQVFYSRLSPADRARLHRTVGILEEDRSALTGEVSHSELHYALAGELDSTLESLARVTQDFLSPRSIELVLGEMPDAKTWASSSSLTPEQEQKALQVLNTLMRVIRSRGSFGGQTHVVEMARQSLVSMVRPLLSDVGPLTVTCAETVFTLNGKNVPAAQAPAEMYAFLNRLKLSGFQLRPGLSDTELLAWVDLLAKTKDSIQDAGGWTQVLSQSGITHVTVSEMIYVGVSETELFDPSKLKDIGTINVRDSRSGELATAPPDLQRVADMIEEVQRSRASEAAVLARLDAIRQMLEDIKARTAAPAVVKPVVETTPVVPVAVAPDVRPELLELAQELGEQAHPQDVVKLLALIRSIEVPLADFMQRTPEQLLHDLEHGDNNHQVAATGALTHMSRKAVPALLKYLSHADNLKARSTVLVILRKVATDADVLMTRRVTESASAEESVRLLENMELGRMPWSNVLNMLLHSASQDVRRHAWAFFHKAAMGNNEKLAIVQELMRTEHPGLVADAARAAGTVRDTSLIAPLAALLKRTFDRQSDTNAVHREVCHALGRIGDPSVLALLKPIVFPSLTQLATKRDSEVRAAALWGIGRIPGWEAEELLERAGADKDASIRSVAKVAIDTRNSQSTHPDVLAQMEQ